MGRDQMARLIGGSFGLVFVVANAGALPTAVAVPLRVLAIGAFLLVALKRRHAVPREAEQASAGFGRRYWYVVAAEVAGVVAGLAVINSVLHTPRATVGWIAFVVGVHFFGLAAVWRRPPLRTLGAAMAACGAVGLALAFCGASAQAVAVVAGIAPGACLLASVLRPGRAAGVAAQA